MPAKRELTMRQLRYMLRLHHDGVSAREIGRTLGVARVRAVDIGGNLKHVRENLRNIIGERHEEIAHMKVHPIRGAHRSGDVDMEGVALVSAGF